MSGTAVSLHYDTLTGTPTSVTMLRNDAGATIQGGFAGVRLAGATIGTLANSGQITSAFFYLSAISGMIATVSGETLASAIDLLTNAAGATIGGLLVNGAGATISGGYTGVLVYGSTIGTLVNSGPIKAGDAYASGGSNETASYGLSAYGNVDLGDGLFVTGNAGYTYDQYDTARTMSFGDLTRTAVGSAKGDEVNAGVSAGYRVRVSNLTLEPQAGLQWLRVSRDGFTETGAGALNLAVARRGNLPGRWLFRRVSYAVRKWQRKSA